MLNEAIGFTTMITRCEEIHGNRCKNWNHEGQWLLNRTSPTTQIFRPGSMCPVNISRVINDNATIGEDLLKQWIVYWDQQASFFVEKSPQSMLKIHFLRSLFEHKYALKFLVVIKHPVTLNTAKVKGYDWQTQRLQNKQIVKNSKEKIRENFDYFVKFMMEYQISESSSCQLGWFQTMKTFMKQLEEIQEFGKKHVRILRYERFISPHKVCTNIFSFLHKEKTQDFDSNVATVNSTESLLY